MFRFFQQYLEHLRPRLDVAFARKLSRLLESIPMKDLVALTGTLASGKKIRGCLSCLISDTLGGTLESAIPRAIAVEMIQTATLIHDDFVDQDFLRRNRPATWTLEGARRAVLIGDVIFADAIKMMDDLGREDGSAVSRAIALVAKGALHEPLDPMMLAGAIEAGKLKEDLYPQIIHLKTGILFGTACLLGAISAETDGPLKEASYRYGLRIGEAYQIADDLKEVNQLVLRRAVAPEEIVALAPMFLYFFADTQPTLMKGLGGKWGEAEEAVLECCQKIVGLMEREIEERLKSAASEIEKNFADSPYSELARSAPREIIQMFNEAEKPTLSAP